MAQPKQGKIDRLNQKLDAGIKKSKDKLRADLQAAKKEAADAEAKEKARLAKLPPKERTELERTRRMKTRLIVMALAVGIIAATVGTEVPMFNEHIEANKGSVLWWFHTMTVMVLFLIGLTNVWELPTYSKKRSFFEQAWVYFTFSIAGTLLAIHGMVWSGNEVVVSIGVLIGIFFAGMCFKVGNEEDEIKKSKSDPLGIRKKGKK